jgi:hypothetical protein
MVVTLTLVWNFSLGANMNKLRITQRAGCELVKAADVVRPAQSDIKLKGRYVVEHWRDGQRINEYHFDNGIVNEGKNKLLDVMFHGITAITTWYCGLIDNAGYSALDATDTYDDVDQAGNGWDEFKLYTVSANATNRSVWPEDAASGQSITNSTVMVFDITGTGTVKGLFLCGGVANCLLKGDHDAGGTLWATALFGSGDVAVGNGDQLKVTYTVSA